MKRPKTIYVRVVDEDDEPYLSASETVADAIEDDGPSTIGVYQLVEMVTAEKTVTVKPGKNARR